MIWAMLVGAGLGGSLLGLWYALVPPRPDLAAAVGRWEAGRAVARLYREGAAVTRRARLGRWLRARAADFGFDLGHLGADLALADRTLEDHLVRKTAMTGFGLVLPTAVTVVFLTVGLAPGFAFPAVAGLVLGAVFFFVPDLSVRHEAQRRREELRRALSCFLDLVSMSMAGGRGVPEALPTSVRIGDGWAFSLLADTLQRARAMGETPWSALTELGERTDMPELRDLGGALSLVADDGAKVRESLAARASTLRRRQLAEAAGEEAKADQSISIAQVLLGVGFLIFLGYPAVINVLTL